MAQSGAVLPRPADERRPAQGVRPPVRRASGPSGQPGPRSRAIPRSCVVHGRREDQARRRARSGIPTCRASPNRRWARSSTCTQSPPVGGDTAFANMYLAYETLSEPIKRLVEGLSAFHTSAHVYSRGEYERSDKKFPEAVPSHRAHPSGDRAQVPVRQSRLHQAHRGPEEARERRACWRCWCATARRRSSSAASAGRSTPSPSGTTAAPCTARRSTTHPHMRHGHRVTIKGDRPF